MSPIDGRSDCGVTYTVKLAEGTHAYAAGFMRPLNFYNLSGCQFKPRPSKAEALPVLLDHVGGVVCGGPEEQMPGVNAVTDIAAMADEEADRDLADKQSPRDAMSAPCLSTEAALAVPLPDGCSVPEPATLIFGNVQ